MIRQSEELPPPRIAVTGIRGIPANFGGSETAAEEVGRRLAADGFPITVYCRTHNSSTPAESYLGMRRVLLPSLNTFSFGTLSHSLLAVLHIIRHNTADIIHFHGVGNALLLPLLRFTGKKTVVTIDGPDWERPKWGPVARAALKLGAWIACKRADRVIIDNHPSIAYFQKRFGVTGIYIPYGADQDPPTQADAIEKFGLRARRYLLFVGALVPDKGPDTLVRAYRRLDTDVPLVIVGDSPFHAEFRRRLREDAEGDERIQFLGYVYGDAYRQLVANCYAYVHPLRSDGTSPALLQAMGYGSCIVVNSIPEALSAVGDAALPFARNDETDLAQTLQRLLEQPSLAEEYRTRAAERARAEYDWDQVADAHASLYLDIAREVGVR